MAGGMEVTRGTRGTGGQEEGRAHAGVMGLTQTQGGNHHYERRCNKKAAPSSSDWFLLSLLSI